MSYQKINFENKPSKNTPINAENLNHMDEGIQKAHEVIDALPEWSQEETKPEYTAKEVGALPEDTDIPAKTSDLENDSGFITKEVGDLANYYTKKEVEVYKANSIKETKSGTTILTTDSANVQPLSLVPYGKSTQTTYPGYQLFDVNDVKANNYVTIDNDGYVTFEYDNTQGTSSVYPKLLINTSELLQPNTSYALVTEIVELSNISMFGIISSSSVSQFKNTIQVGSGLTKGTRLDIVTTLDDFGECECMLRCGATIVAGASGKIKFRISVIKDTTVTADTFVYEPYVGGEASPNINYPQPIVGIGQRLATGKQLLDYENNFKVLNNGFTVTKTLDGGLHIVGTNNTSGILTILNLVTVSIPDSLELNKTYTYICRGLPIKCYTNISQIGRIIGADSKTITWTNSGIEAFNIEVSAGTSMDTIIYPMLVEGTYMPAHELYGVDEGSVVDMNVKQVMYGGNICPKTEGTTTHNGVTFNFKGDYVVVTGTKSADIVEANSANLVIQLPIVKGTYYLPIGYTSKVKLSIKRADGTRTYPDNQWTFDGTELFAKLYISIYQSGEAVTVNETIPLFCNLGTERMPCEEYKEPQILFLQTPNGLGGIPLGQTIPDVIANSSIHMSGVYWDEVEQQYYIGDTKNENGKDVQRIGKEVMDLASTTESLGVKYADDGVNIRYFSRNVANLGHINTLHLMSNKFTKGNYYPQINFADNRLIFWNTKKDGSYGFADKESFIEAAGEFEIYYVLADPIITDTTEEELEQFEALRMNYPNTTVVNDAGAYTELEYVADTKEHITQNYIHKSDFNEALDRISALEQNAVNS